MTIEIDAFPHCNWVSEVRRRGGVAGPPVLPSPTVGEDPPPTSEQAHATVVELGYSPGQKRDTKGRFGSGGGGAPGGGGGSGTAGPTPEGEASRTKLEQDAADAIGPWGGGQSYEDKVREHSALLKAEAMTKVGADLDGKFPPDQLTAQANALYARTMSGQNVYAPEQLAPPPGERMLTPGERVADGMMSQWAMTAYNQYQPESMALQRAVADEFGTGYGKNMEAGISASAHGIDWATRGHDQAVLRAGVRSMYTHTQQQLTDLGVGDTVTLHRGIRSDDRRGDIDVDFNPATSFTSSRVVAATKFTGAGNLGTVMTMTVPRSRVLTMPGAGLGCFEEHELLVMRGTGDVARGSAP